MEYFTGLLMANSSKLYVFLQLLIEKGLIPERDSFIKFKQIIAD